MTRWGVLGASSTVARLAVLPALRASSENELVAAGSRSGGEPGMPVTVSYEEVLDDDAVEIVYVALPNGLHHEWVLACEEAGVLLAEAYMTPFHPRVAAFEGACHDGRTGEPRLASARFTFPHADPDDHRWDPLLGGGALADLGVYVLEGLCGIAGRPPDEVGVRAVEVSSRGGVDATTVALLDLGEGLAGEMVVSMELPEEQVLELRGTAGGLRTTHAFTPDHEDRALVRIAPDGAQELVETAAADPYMGMVEHVGAAVRGEVRLERSAGRAVALLGLADRIRVAGRSG